MVPIAWTDEAVAFLVNNYPEQGKVWCAESLACSATAIRAKAYKLKLRTNRQSDFRKVGYAERSQRMIGKKRPRQAAIMRAKFLLDPEKFPLLSFAKTSEGRAKISLRVRALWQTRGHPRGALGMRHTDETRRKVSESSLRHWAGLTLDQRAEHTMKGLRTKAARGITARPRPEASWKCGWRTIGGQRAYFRSRWEANYARYLELLRSRGAIVDWKHEPMTFWFEKIKRGARSYLPDFRVTKPRDVEEYHEVKGWMDARSRTKIRRMAKYHPKVTLIVIDGKVYRALEKQIAGACPGWEYPGSTLTVEPA